MDSPTVGARRSALRVLGAVLAAGASIVSPLAQSGGVPAPPSPAAEPALQVASLLKGTLPVVTEHRYRIAGKIRPLLLFWVGRDNVGSARVRWRRGERGDTGYDLLIGSDPARAPRRLNRWGFVMEENDASGASILGVMKKSDEETLDQAKSNVVNEAGAGAVFKIIRATVGPSESVARVSEANVGRDYSYRELDGLMERLLNANVVPATRTTPLPPNGRRGFLLSLAELLHDGVEGAKATSKAPGRKNLPYVFYRKPYDLLRVSAAIEQQATYGGVTYPRLLKQTFELRARGESWVENFAIVCGIDGPLAEVPIFMTYQPRWWLKLEMVLDEHQAF